MAFRNHDLADVTRGNVFTGTSSFSLQHKIKRAVFYLSWLLLARWTPAPFHLWRVFVLRLFGADVQWSVKLHGSVIIWQPRNLTIGERSVVGPGAILYNVDLITLGSEVVVSQRAHLCCGSHDIADPDFPLVHKPIIVRDKAWIAAEAFVGPGVTVGRGAVLGARGVTAKDLDSWTVYVGNPAVKVKKRPEPG